MKNGLVSLRQRAKWTQERAATAMGLSRGGYIKLERSERKLSENHIRAAMAAFSASESEVLGYSSPNGTPALTSEDFERLKLACAAFVEAFSDTVGARQWIEELEAAVLQPPGGEHPMDQAEIRARAAAIAASAKFRLRQKKP